MWRIKEVKLSSEVTEYQVTDGTGVCSFLFHQGCRRMRRPAKQENNHISR